jgi:hypothetical protein
MPAAVPMILMAFAFVCFALSVFPASEPHRSRLVPAGLAFWALTVILGYSGVLGK